MSTGERLHFDRMRTIHEKEGSISRTLAWNRVCISRGMSKPRQVLPGSTYLLTRRCLQRRFLLRPSQETNRILEFCLAHAANTFRIEVHAYCFMSNHYHLVVTDPHANLPRFMHWMNEHIAKCLQEVLGHRETFWSPGSYNAVRLIDPSDIIAKLVYTAANPVSSFLVPHPRNWPGTIGQAPPTGIHRRIVARPPVYFRPDGPVPPSVTLELRAPSVLADMANWHSSFKSALRTRIAELRGEARNRQGGFLGIPKVLAVHPFARPDREEEQRNLQPQVAGRNPSRRREALASLRMFWDQYRAAWESFRAGKRDTVFPFGTYLMRERWGVSCAGP